MRAALSLICVVLLAGCATTAQTVATDLKVIDKPVIAKCTINWPQKPIAAVEQVQLTGDPKKDLVLIERAKEAELGYRMVYEKLLEVAALACVEPPAK